MRSPGRQGREAPVHEHQCLLIPVDGAPVPCLPTGEQEIAELLETSVENLAPMQYGFDVGQERFMYMRRAEQLDREAPVNKPASHGVALAGVPVTIRGPALLVVGGAPWAFPSPDAS